MAGRGDATGGRGYIEPGTVTEKKPNGDARAFNVPLGDNPYFPTPAPTEQAGSAEETAAPDPETSEGGEPGVVQHADSEPTFDTDTDRANGIDTDSPEYKHFQRAFTKARQRDKTDVEKQLEAMEAKLEASIVKRKLEEAPKEPTPQDEAVVRLTFDGFPVPRLPEGSQLAGLEEEIVELFKPMAQAVINDVARQQQAAYQRMQAEQTKSKITDFVTEIERSHPEKVTQVLTDLEEYSAVAKSNPDKGVNFVKKSLGLNEETQPAQPAPSAQRLVQKQQSAVPRPTSSNGAFGQPRVPKTTREAIEMALDSQVH